jgi:hypothetical protein
LDFFFKLKQCKLNLKNDTKVWVYIDKTTDGSKFECKSNNLLLLNLKRLTSGLLKNLEQNNLLLNLENFTNHCLKNPEIWLVLLIGPLLIRTYCVYSVKRPFITDCTPRFLDLPPALNDVSWNVTVRRLSVSLCVLYCVFTLQARP